MEEDGWNINGEAWQINYTTLPQTCLGKHLMLTMMEANTRWLETYPTPHATAWNTILAFEKGLLWKHESYNRIHFWNNLIDTWAKEHGTEWEYHRAYHAPASGKSNCYNGLLRTVLAAMCACAGMSEHWDTHTAKAASLVAPPNQKWLHQTTIKHASPPLLPQKLLWRVELKVIL